MRQAYNRKGRVSYLRIVATAATLLVAPAFHAMAAAEQKVALVIGNSAYPSSRLRNPVNDAKAMAEKLRALGFEVILRTDSNLREMTRSFSQFGQKLTPGSVSLFYYAGHGVQVRGKNYLIPVDAEIENEASVTSEAVDVDQLLNQLGPARLSMVILDACRNNPFERRFRAAGSGGLAQIDAPTGTLLAYATAPGKVAADGHGSNGVYTEALLKALDMPGLKVEDVFKQVRINVVRASDGQQTPWESSSLTGEFYFHAASKAEIDSAQLRRAENERAELARTLEEERRKRDKDAELVRAEMEKLRAELQKIRADSGSAQPAVAAATAGATEATPNSTTAPAQHPQKIAIATSPMQGGPVSPASNPTHATASTLASEWAPRLALLEKTPGQLTFSKAIAILLDISSDRDLSLILTHENEAKRKTWHNSYAMGTDSKGNLIWGGAYQFRSSTEASKTAREQCASGPGASCNVLMVNGDFLEKGFVEMAKRLGARSVSAVRQSFLQRLNKPAVESIVGIGGPSNSYLSHAMGYSSPRD